MFLGSLGQVVVHFIWKWQQSLARKKLHRKIIDYRSQVDGKYRKVNTLIEKQIFLRNVSESNDYDTNIASYVKVRL